MEPIKIEPSNESERDWCSQLIAESEPWITLNYTLEHSRQRMHDPEYLLFIAHLNQKPCGFIQLQRRGVAGSPYVATIATDPEFRSQGIGDALLNFAEDYFRPEAKHIFLCVSSFNNRAKQFYEHHGYTVVGELRDYVIEGASEILMHKWLKKL
jgi:ribosomal protein S18 acetylase RimI-like enzyme